MFKRFVRPALIAAVVLCCGLFVNNHTAQAQGFAINIGGPGYPGYYAPAPYRAYYPPVPAYGYSPYVTGYRGYGYNPYVGYGGYYSSGYAPSYGGQRHGHSHCW
jgi:hypothetical protein